MNTNPFAAHLASAAAATKGTARRDRLDRVEIVDGPAFHFTAPALTGPTARQEELIVSLLSERNIYADAQLRPKYFARISELWTSEQRAAQLDRTTASAFIDYLMTLPVKVTDVPTSAPAQVEIPAGRYAVNVNGTLWFVKVDRPEAGKWAGYTFVRRQLGSELNNVNKYTRNRVLKDIAAQGVRECAVRYGHELGQCAMCGRELTNEASRLAGIGPICADKNGW